MDNEESLPAMDDVQVDGQSEQQLLDAVMQGSELAQGIFLPYSSACIRRAFTSPSASALL